MSQVYDTVDRFRHAGMGDPDKPDVGLGGGSPPKSNQTSDSADASSFPSTFLFTTTSGSLSAQAASSNIGTSSSISTPTASEGPSASATSGNNGISSRNLAAIVAPVVVVSVTIFLLVLFFLGRRSRRKKRDLQEVSHSQMRDASGGGVLKDNWRVSERASGVPLHGVHSNSFAEPIPRQTASLQIPSIQSPDGPPAIGNPQRGLRESTGNQAQETTRVSYHQYHDAGHAARTEGNLAAFTGENPERRSESPFDDPVRPDDVSDISRPGSPVDEMDSISDVSSIDDEHNDHDGHNAHNAHNEENQ